MAKKKYAYKKAKKQWGKKKKKGKVSKSFKRDFYRMFLKYVDKKSCVYRLRYDPTNIVAPAGNCLWCVTDQGFDFSNDKSAITVTAANQWGRTGALQGYKYGTKFPILVGNGIKRTGFSITYELVAAYFTGNGPGNWALQDMLNTTATNPSSYFTGDVMTCSVRISLVRATKSIRDEDVEAYLASLDDTQYEDPWNKTVVVVLYDKYHVLGLNTSTAKNRIVKSLRFKGKKGAQKINIAVNPITGTMLFADGYMTQGKIYVVYRYRYTTFTWGGNTVQVLPEIVKMVIRNTYLDA